MNRTNPCTEEEKEYVYREKLRACTLTKLTSELYRDGSRTQGLAKTCRVLLHERGVAWFYNK